MKKRFRRAVSLVPPGISKWSEYTGLFCGAALVVAAFIIVQEVIQRGLLVQSTIWQTEFVIILVIMAGFIGAAYGVKHKGHIHVEVVTAYIPPKPREILMLANMVLALVAAVVLMRFGWPMWWDALIGHECSETVWGPPLAIPYLFMPLGMVFMIAEISLEISRRITVIRAWSKESREQPGGD